MERALRLKELLRRWEQRLGCTRPITVVVAVKGRSVEEIRAVTATGFSILGENRLQEFFQHHPHFPEAEWHFIGTIQSRKIPHIVRCFSLIHSLDSLDDALKMEKVAQTEHKRVRVLVEINAVAEPTKAGILPDELFPFVAQLEKQCPSLLLEGIMSLPPLIYPVEKMRPVYANLSKLYLALQQQYPERPLVFSAGTTDDFEFAIEMGVNMIRLGRFFFERGPT